jgi:hypothetical protein
MSQTVKLIPLLCPNCQAPVPAQPDETAWVCDTCGHGLALDEERGSSAVDVFFSASILPNKVGNPYWVSRGGVVISKRLTYHGNQNQAAEQFWARSRLFFVPAWRLPVADIVAQGVRLLREPLVMQTGSRAHIQPVVLGRNDIKPLAEFMVMSIEADRSDAMRELGFSVTLDPPQLWILP